LTLFPYFRSVHGHIDFLGTGPVTLLEETEFSERLKEEHLHLSFFAFSDLWLDNPQTLTGLKSILESCIENAFIPKVFIFCGNFCSTGVVTLNGKDVLRYQGTGRLSFIVA
jgi:DNA polymerase epsilon subunit 2